MRQRSEYSECQNKEQKVMLENVKKTEKSLKIRTQKIIKDRKDKEVRREKECKKTDKIEEIELRSS